MFETRKILGDETHRDHRHVRARARCATRTRSRSRSRRARTLERRGGARAAGGHAGPRRSSTTRHARLPDRARRRRPGRGVRRPPAPRSRRTSAACSLWVVERQPAQGRRDERGADRRGPARAVAGRGFQPRHERQPEPAGRLQPAGRNGVRSMTGRASRPALRHFVGSARRMRLYPASATARNRTLTGDLAVLALLLVVRLAGRARRTTRSSSLTSIGRSIEDSGRAISATTREHGRRGRQRVRGRRQTPSTASRSWASSSPGTLRHAPSAATSALRAPGDEQGGRIVRLGVEQVDQHRDGRQLGGLARVPAAERDRCCSYEPCRAARAPGAAR